MLLVAEHAEGGARRPELLLLEPPAHDPSVRLLLAPHPLAHALRHQKPGAGVFPPLFKARVVGQHAVGLVEHAVRDVQAIHEAAQDRIHAVVPVAEPGVVVAQADADDLYARVDPPESLLQLALEGCLVHLHVHREALQLHGVILHRAVLRVEPLCVPLLIPAVEQGDHEDRAIQARERREVARREVLELARDEVPAAREGGAAPGPALRLHSRQCVSDLGCGEDPPCGPKREAVHNHLKDKGVVEESQTHSADHLSVHIHGEDVVPSPQRLPLGVPVLHLTLMAVSSRLHDGAQVIAGVLRHTSERIVEDGSSEKQQDSRTDHPRELLKPYHACQAEPALPAVVK
mmetsp:Transcript_139455/g.362598  ORF Transcript_139455/g.362598 Transcript_139455/m.362598 type:complete len:346 (-) Transcript_139455:390-1427(-)